MSLEKELIARFVDALSARKKPDDGLALPGWGISEWELLFTGAHSQELKEGEILLRKGDTSSDLYFVVDGSLEVSATQADSVSMSPLASIGPGSVVGELAFLDGLGRSATVWSRGQSILLRLRRHKFQQFMDEHPKLACDLLLAIGRIVATRLRKRNGNAQLNPFGF
jgi:CRP-like cAMP-binding protein